MRIISVNALKSSEAFFSLSPVVCDDYKIMRNNGEKVKEEKNRLK